MVGGTVRFPHLFENLLDPDLVHIGVLVKSHLHCPDWVIGAGSLEGVPGAEILRFELALHASEAPPVLADLSWLSWFSRQAPHIRQKRQLDQFYHLGPYCQLVLGHQSGTANHGGLDMLSPIQFIHSPRTGLRHAFCKVSSRRFNRVRVECPQYPHI